MKTLKRARRLFIGLVLLVLAVLSVFFVRSQREPTHNGKLLSAWLNDLGTVDSRNLRDQKIPGVVAVTAIGTNALPWLIGEFTKEPSAWYWEWRVNWLLAKQSLIKFRFPTADERLIRATRGFDVLGPVAAPAIPELMSVVEKLPGYAPGALAGIGPPAFPALEQCLTNRKIFQTARGAFTPIPGNTIAALENEIYAERISKEQAAVFVPQIRELAKSTNANAAIYATNFLKMME
jgi:hypothetical protein